MITVFSFSEAGGHPVNEDAFVVQQHPVDSDCWLCCLADGQGGQAGGAAAAQLACRTTLEQAIGQPPARLLNPKTWTTILRQADEAVRLAPRAGYTTLIGFCIRGKALVGASSGDSAVLVVSRGEHSQEITAKQVKNPPVGSGAAIFIPFTAKLVGRWAVLAMSDGVWKYVGWERITELAATESGQALVEALQGKARCNRPAIFHFVALGCVK